MPTYQYRCSECGQDLEVVQKFSDAALTECPNCQGQLRKVYNAVGVVFKGSGFYSTDNRSSSKSSNGAANGDSAGKSDASGDKKSETSGSKESSSGSKESSNSPAPAKAAAG